MPSSNGAGVGAGAPAPTINIVQMAHHRYPTPQYFSNTLLEFKNLVNSNY
jgi:hypothetical protein